MMLVEVVGEDVAACSMTLVTTEGCEYYEAEVVEE
jgi:hypothetical protein